MAVSHKVLIFISTFKNTMMSTTVTITKDRNLIAVTKSGSNTVKIELINEESDAVIYLNADEAKLITTAIINALT